MTITFFPVLHYIVAWLLSPCWSCSILWLCGSKFFNLPPLLGTSWPSLKTGWYFFFLFLKTLCALFLFYNRCSLETCPSYSFKKLHIIMSYTLWYSYCKMACSFRNSHQHLLNVKICNSSTHLSKNKLNLIIKGMPCSMPTPPPPIS